MTVKFKFATDKSTNFLADTRARLAVQVIKYINLAVAAATIVMII